MMRWGAFLATLGFVMPMASQALVAPPMPECYWDAYNSETDSYSRRMGAAQWPNGFVTEMVEYGPNAQGWKAEFGAEITECASGRMLIIDTHGSSESIEQSAGLFAFLDQERDSANTLDQVRDLARREGWDATMYTDDEERCGCATFYPELRGDKTPFDADTYYGATE